MRRLPEFKWIVNHIHADRTSHHRIRLSDTSTKFSTVVFCPGLDSPLCSHSPLPPPLLCHTSYLLYHLAFRFLPDWFAGGAFLKFGSAKAPKSSKIPSQMTEYHVRRTHYTLEQQPKTMLMIPIRSNKIPNIVQGTQDVVNSGW